MALTHAVLFVCLLRLANESSIYTNSWDSVPPELRASCADMIMKDKPTLETMSRMAYAHT
jgi:hypothetical protein